VNGSRAGRYRKQEIVAKDIERFGKREHLKVAWQRPQAPTTQPTTQPGQVS